MKWRRRNSHQVTCHNTDHIYLRHHKEIPWQKVPISKIFWRCWNPTTLQEKLTQNTIRNISPLQTNFHFTANMAWSKPARQRDKRGRLLTDLMGIWWRLASDDSLCGPRSSTYLVGRNLRFALGDFEYLHLDSSCRHHDELDCLFYNAIYSFYHCIRLPVHALLSWSSCLQATVFETLASILLIQIPRVCSRWIVLSTARVV